MRRSDGLKPVGLGEREALGRCVGVTTGGAALSLDSVGEVAAAARDNVSKPLKIHKYTNTHIHKYTNTKCIALIAQDWRDWR